MEQDVLSFSRRIQKIPLNPFVPQPQYSVLLWLVMIVCSFCLAVFFYFFILTLQQQPHLPIEVPRMGEKNAPRTTCGLENCHGVNVTCGPNVPEACDAMYSLGDGCRGFASCEIVNNTCQLKPNPYFDACKSCVTKCTTDFPNDPDKAFACESTCYDNGDIY